MTHLQTHWEHKTDEQLLDAALDIDQYTTEGQTAALQWISVLLVMALPRGSFAANAVALVLLGAFVVSMVMTPITGYKLVNRLDVESPVRLAALMYSPLFSLLSVPLVAAYARRWGRRREIEMGIVGPTRIGLDRLRQRD